MHKRHHNEIINVAKASYFMGCIGIKPDEEIEYNEWAINYCLNEVNNINIEELVKGMKK